MPSLDLPLPRLALAISLVLVTGFSVWLVLAYGLEDYAVQLVPGFAAALLAFVIALAWERDREAKQLTESAERLPEQQGVEVQRRLRTVRDELDADLKSFQDVKRDLAPMVAVHPQLLDGAWKASAPSLAELVADYKLIADIARTYGRIEELRWRLRTRTQLALQGGPEAMTGALIDELIPETEELLERMDAEIKEPSVRLDSAIVVRTGLAAEVSVAGSMETKVIRANEKD